MDIDFAGDETAYNGGQVSLSPVPHVAREPIGISLGAQRICHESDCRPRRDPQPA
ncbi:MAG: hypothetical protein HY655_10415 [Acidobacteria bacterium]|nr:hypothetical protein [Acidobacteriota bacterium]